MRRWQLQTVDHSHIGSPSLLRLPMFGGTGSQCFAKLKGIPLLKPLCSRFGSAACPLAAAEPGTGRKASVGDAIEDEWLDAIHALFPRLRSSSSTQRERLMARPRPRCWSLDFTSSTAPVGTTMNCSSSCVGAAQQMHSSCSGTMVFSVAASSRRLLRCEPGVDVDTEGRAGMALRGDASTDEYPDQGVLTGTEEAGESVYAHGEPLPPTGLPSSAHDSCTHNVDVARGLVSRRCPVSTSGPAYVEYVRLCQPSWANAWRGSGSYWRMVQQRGREGTAGQRSFGPALVAS